MSTVGDRQILNAARACVLAAGVHETTFNDIARRAGVSRMTLYRRYSDVGSLISELLGREFARILREHTQIRPDAPPDPRSARQRLVGTVLAVVEAFQEDPLMSQVLDAEPEILTPYLFNKFGSTQQIALDLLAHRLDAGHRDGSIRAGSVAVQAHAVVLTVQSFIVSATASGPVPADRLRTELGLILEGYLTPPCPAPSTEPGTAEGTEPGAAEAPTAPPPIR